MAVFGYVRTSATHPDPELQKNLLFSAGCTEIVTEDEDVFSQVALWRLIGNLACDDTLIVTELDRLATSFEALERISQALIHSAVRLRVLSPEVDTYCASSVSFLSMLGVFAEFEKRVKAERRVQGIERAKALGVYKGRRSTINTANVAAMKREGLGATEIAKRLGIARTSVYRVLKQAQSPD